MAWKKVAKFVNREGGITEKAIFPFWRRTAIYVLSKLSGAGMGLVAGFAYIWGQSGFDAFEPFEALRPDEAFGPGLSLFFWLMLYGYGMLVTFAIDGLGHWKPGFRKTAVQASLHAVAGLLFFLVMPVRAPFPLQPRHLRNRRSGRSALRPSLLHGEPLGTAVGLGPGLARPRDSAHRAGRYPEGVKQDGKKTRGEGLYEAEFRYMNGTQNIHVYARKGQVISFTMTWQSDKRGGYGMQVRGPGGPNDCADYRPGPPLSGDSRGFGGKIHADRDGEYIIIASGNRIKSKLKVARSVDPKTE